MVPLTLQMAYIEALLHNAKLLAYVATNLKIKLNKETEAWERTKFVK